MCNGSKNCNHILEKIAKMLKQSFSCQVNVLGYNMVAMGLNHNLLGCNSCQNGKTYVFYGIKYGSCCFENSSNGQNSGGYELKQGTSGGCFGLEND